MAHHDLHHGNTRPAASTFAATEWTTVLRPAAMDVAPLESLSSRSVSSSSSSSQPLPPIRCFTFRRSSTAALVSSSAQRELLAYAGTRGIIPLGRVPQQQHQGDRLHHRHIAKPFRGVDGLTAVELCNDGTLSEWLTTANPTAAERLEALQQIAAAVEYLHGVGYAHGDVRPANIMRHRITAGACAYAGHGCTGQLEPVTRTRRCSVCQGAHRDAALQCTSCHYGVCSRCRSYSGTFFRLAATENLIPRISYRTAARAEAQQITYDTIERLARQRGLNPATAATVPYQAPEVLEALCSEGQPTLNLALNDVWALGCVAYEMMTGKSWWSDVQRMSRRTDDHDSVGYYELSAPLLSRVGHPDVEAALRVALIEVNQRGVVSTFRRRLGRQYDPLTATFFLLACAALLFYVSRRYLLVSFQNE